MESNHYVFKALLMLIFYVQGVTSVICTEEATDHCENWACTDVGALGTCADVGGVTPTRCSKNFYFGMSGDNFEYDKFAECNTGSELTTDCLFEGTYAATCREYCATDNCNQDLYTVATTTAAPTTAKSCVQCTSTNPNGACFKNPAMTLCNGGIEVQYCTTLHAVSLAANGEIADQVVFRGCAADMHADGCSAGPLTIGGTTYKQAITCSKTCSGGDGCNNKAVPLDMGINKGSGLTCKYCRSTNGQCSDTTDMICPSSHSYCYHKMVYTEGSSYLDGELTIVSEERGCSASEKTSQCTTVISDIINSKIETKSCQESCTSDLCNNEAFPNRPRCSQCHGRYWLDDGMTLIPESDPLHFKWCKENPPMPMACPDISYTHCFAYQKYIPDEDNEVKWGYSKEFKRGCLKESSWSKCMNRDRQDGRKADHCQFVCNEDDCNLGSGSSEVNLGTLAVMVAIAIRQIMH